MKQTILIAGSGKMAWSIGGSFLEKGFAVHWITGSPEQQSGLRQRIAKIRRRTAAFFPDHLEEFDADCHLLSAGDIPTPDVILESTGESLVKKRAVFTTLAPLITERTLLFSNSSSLLPSTLHRNCLGAHFFYPVQLTACIELIVPEACDEDRRRKSLGFFREIGYDILEQDETTAFLVNRLLLPLQAACLQALQDGFPAPMVDEASKSALIGIGQLSMMDAIGLDLIHTAAINYRNLPDTNIQACDLLISGLEQILAFGNRGKKGEGLRTGAHLPWPTGKAGNEEVLALRKNLGAALKEACLHEYRRKSISLDQLRMVCERIFQAGTFAASFYTQEAEEES